jgi:hypothetical protein
MPCFYKIFEFHTDNLQNIATNVDLQGDGSEVTLNPELVGSGSRRPQNQGSVNSTDMIPWFTQLLAEEHLEA